MGYTGGVRPRLPLILAFVLPVLAGVAASWPLLRQGGTHHALSAWGDSHVWVMAQVADALAAGEWPDPTGAAGFPELRRFRPIGGPLLLVGAALVAAVGPLWTAALLPALSLGASGLAVAVALRALVPGLGAGAAAALGVCFALSPPVLGLLATGELPALQLWALALGFHAGAHARDTGRLAPLGVAGLVAGLTHPGLALALPLGLPLLWLGAGAPWRRLPASLLVLGVGLAPAALLFAPAAAGGAESLFTPARPAEVLPTRLPWPPPVAPLDALLWPTGRPPGSPHEPVHTVWLGPLWLVAAAGLRRGGRAGPAFVALGVLLALGPALAWGDRWAFGGARVWLPLAGLEALGFPTRHSALTYRYAVVALWGLVLLLGTAAAGAGPRVRAGLWALALTQGLAGAWAAGPFPRPVERLPAAALPPGDDGAVLELPVQGPTSAWFGQGALLRAAVHGRPTTALPRTTTRADGPVAALLRGAAASPTPGAALRRAGLRFVVLPDALRPFLGATEAALVRGLGPPTDASGGAAVWDLGPPGAAQ